jgi:hypothetical protein
MYDVAFLRELYFFFWGGGVLCTGPLVCLITRILYAVHKVFLKSLNGTIECKTFSLCVLTSFRVFGEYSV